MRVTFLTVVPSPYMRELFASMHRDGRIVPNVFYSAMGVPGFDWGIQELESYERVLSPPKLRLSTALLPNSGVVASLALSSADIFVVCGYRLPTMQIAMHWLRRNRLPWVFFGERPGVSKRNSIGTLVRSLAKRPAVHWPSGIAAVGSLAVDAYRRETSRRIPIVNLPYFTDLQPFRQKRSFPGRSPSRLRVLYCGQLIFRKGVDLLIDAVCALSDRGRKIELTLVGDGDQRQGLQRQVPPHLKHVVRFLGFKPPSQLPDLFQEADILALPSRHDGWGVVVNQALAACLPVVASDRVGAARDLINDDVNGFVFPTGSKVELEKVLDRLTWDRTLCQRLSDGAAKTSETIDLPSGVTRWYDFLSQVADRERSSSTSTKCQSGPCESFI